MKALILISIILLSINFLFLYGCASVDQRNPEEILNSSLYQENNNNNQVSHKSLDLKTNDLPYVPILLPPEVERIWIYPHVTPTGELVTGHWIFIKVNDSKWYLEDFNSLRSIQSSDIKIPLPVEKK